MFPSLIMILTAAAGGAAGTVLRYEAVWLGSMLFGTSFPAGTVFVNCSGSLLIGMLSSFFMFRGGSHPLYAVFFITGILGGYTTFSSFANECFQYLLAGRWQEGLMYLFLQPILGTLAAASGFFMVYLIHSL